MSQQEFVPYVSSLPLIHQGKVRDTYETISDQYCLMVTTNRISTHNIVHQSEVPLKGQVLTALTVFWARYLEEMGVDTHLVASGKKIYNYLPCGAYPSDLHLRALVCRSLRMLPVEFIFRLFMAGSLWKEYYSKGLPNPYGIDIPKGMQLMEAFKHFQFTPTDKSETDDPLDSNETRGKYSDAYQVALYVLTAMHTHLSKVGLTLVDTKMEFGVKDGGVVLADEFGTPDCSRIVRTDSIVIGQDPPWLDKQFVREEAEGLWAGGKKVPLVFSQETIDQTIGINLAVFRIITGESLQDFQRNYMR